jgi:hypothetical protein
MVNDVTSENGEGGIRHNRVDGIVHAFFKRKWHIAHVIAIGTSWKLGIARFVLVGIGSGRVSLDFRLGPLKKDTNLQQIGLPSH